MGAIGANDEPGSPEETAWAFRRLFETLAFSRPLVVVVDDIHWAEAGVARPARVRPRLLEQRPGLLTLPRAPRRLRRPTVLGDAPAAYDPRVARPLERRRVRGSDRGADGRRRRWSGAPRSHRRRGRGQPLFVEQMLAMLADDPDAADDSMLCGDDSRAPRPASSVLSRVSGLCFCVLRSRVDCSTAAPSQNSCRRMVRTGWVGSSTP